MDEEAKLGVLAHLAQAFNKQGVCWSLGASCFLYLKGIAPTFHDLDFMVVKEDCAKADQILSTLGKKQPERYDHLHYGTLFFGEYVVEGVDVDLMADFSIIKDGKEYPFPLKKENIDEVLLLQGEKIPLEKLSLWRERYLLMGRESKVEMIDAALRKKEIEK
jgi:hypothetical protein